MRNHTGDVREAGPSIAVQMTGLSSVPQAGDEFDVFETESEVRVRGRLQAWAGCWQAGRQGRPGHTLLRARS